MDNKLEQEARRLFEINAKGWRNAISWEELHEDTRQIWRDFAQKRITTPRSELSDALRASARNLPENDIVRRGLMNIAADRLEALLDAGERALKALDYWGGKNAWSQAGEDLSDAIAKARLVEQSARSEITQTAHTDHPLRHFDRTCPACVEEQNAAPINAALQEGRTLSAVTDTEPAVAAPSAGTPRTGTHWPGCGMDGGHLHYECLQRDFERLKAELVEARTVQQAWWNVFETTQLSHASARLQAAEAKAAQSASGPTREQVESLIKRIDDAMAFGMTGRDALPNLLRDCLAALAAVGGKSDG